MSPYRFGGSSPNTGARLRDLEENVQDQTHSVHLLIRPLACVVLVLIVWIELDVFAHWQQATRVEISRADFCVLALVEELGADVRCGVVVADREAPFGR